MQFNLCGLIQMLLPLRYELDYRPEDNLMEAWELDDCPQYYVWDHVALALHVESGQVRSLRSSRCYKSSCTDVLIIFCFFFRC